MSYNACASIPVNGVSSQTEQTPVLETGNYSPGSDWATFLGGSSFTINAPAAGNVLVQCSYNASAGLLGRFAVDGTAITEPSYADLPGMQSDALWVGSAGPQGFSYVTSVTSGSHYFELQLKAYSSGGGSAPKLGTRTLSVTFLG